MNQILNHTQSYGFNWGNSVNDYTYHKRNLEWGNNPKPPVITDRMVKENDKIFNPTKCIHGFGYSILSSESKNLKKQLTEFVAKDDNVKLYLLELENKLDEDQELDIAFWINTTLGNFEEKTSRHILS